MSAESHTLKRPYKLREIRRRPRFHLPPHSLPLSLWVRVYLNKEKKMQQPPSVMPVMSSFPPTNITTEQIQKYLDENKKLILAILDNQNLGKLAECAQYQAQLQKNLMYLAAIADAQPQMPAMPTQMAAAASPHPAMQQGGYYMHPQGAGPGMGQNPQGGFSPKMQLQFGSPHQQLHQQQQQQQHQQQLHQQAMQGQMNMRSGGGPGNGMHPMHSEGGGPIGGGQNRQSGLETDAPGSSAGGDNAKGAEEGK